jgi:hypothetical protein
MFRVDGIYVRLEDAGTFDVFRVIYDPALHPPLPEMQLSRRGFCHNWALATEAARKQFPRLKLPRSAAAVAAAAAVMQGKDRSESDSDDYDYDRGHTSKKTVTSKWTCMRDLSSDDEDAEAKGDEPTTELPWVGVHRLRADGTKQTKVVQVRIQSYEGENEPQSVCEPHATLLIHYHPIAAENRPHVATERPKTRNSNERSQSYYLPSWRDFKLPTIHRPQPTPLFSSNLDNKSWMIHDPIEWGAALFRCDRQHLCSFRTQAWSSEIIPPSERKPITEKAPFHEIAYCTHMGVNDSWVWLSTDPTLPPSTVRLKYYASPYIFVPFDLQRQRPLSRKDAIAELKGLLPGHGSCEMVLDFTGDWLWEVSLVHWKRVIIKQQTAPTCLRVSTCVKEVDGQKVLVAKELIRQGTIVWWPNFNAMKRYPTWKDTENKAFALRVQESTTDAQVRELLKYAYGWKFRVHYSGDCMIELLDDSKYITHSDQPNLTQVEELSIANRNILPDEPLTEDFSEFWIPPFYQSLCQTFNVPLPVSPPKQPDQSRESSNDDHNNNDDDDDDVGDMGFTLFD